MSFIHPTAIIGEDVKIGKDVYIGPYCIIGFPAEDKKNWGKGSQMVEIGDGARITGHVTIDGGTDSITIIGSDTFIMKGAHIGHDATISRGATIACHSLIGGWTEVGQHANLGLGCIVHQRTKIGAYSMLGMGTVVTKRSVILPGFIYVGAPAEKIRLNKIGLDRNNINEGMHNELIKNFM